MLTRASLAAIFLLITAQTAIANTEPGLLTFLRAYLAKGAAVDASATRFASTTVRAGRPNQEVVVYVSGRDWCGAGGCHLLVLVPQAGSFRVIGRVTIARPPIRVLTTFSHGRPDLAVWVQGGGIQPGYQARLSFDGRRYPGNPSMLPARPMKHAAAGRTIITGDEPGASAID
jgi:hypothetical protein